MAASSMQRVRELRKLAPARMPVPAATASGEELLRFALSHSVARLLRYDARIRVTRDPDDIHQARVATRRLRSDLRTFQRCVDPDWAAGLRDELRAVARVLGSVRDPDVLLNRIDRDLAALDPADRAAAVPLRARLEHERETARGQLRALLDSAAYLDLVEQLVEAARAPRAPERARRDGADAAPESEADRAARQLDRRWLRLARRVDRLPKRPSTAALHRVRIDVKRARYTAESVAPLLGRRVERFGRALARAQDVLGEHHDAAVACAWLRGAAPELPRGAAFVAGRLAERAARRARRAEARWRRAWKRVTNRRMSPARTPARALAGGEP